MIYASLKPIRQWHTARVPLAFLLIGHASGALLIVCAMATGRATGDAWLVTAVYYFYQYIMRSAPAVMMPQLSEAFGLSTLGVASPRHAGTTPNGRRATARIGHSKARSDRQFVATLRLERIRRAGGLRAEGVQRGDAVAWQLRNVNEAVHLYRACWRIGAVAWLACMNGFSAERWLFFAEARHVVRLYHGDRTT
jgi:DMSO reductase anchor subunit